MTKTTTTPIKLELTTVVRFKATVTNPMNGAKVSRDYSTIGAAKEYLNRNLNDVFCEPELEKIEISQVK